MFKYPRWLIRLDSKLALWYCHASVALMHFDDWLIDRLPTISFVEVLHYIWVELTYYSKDGYLLRN